MTAPVINRRQFGQGVGALVIAFGFARASAWAGQPPSLPGSLNDNRMLDAWLRIDADGSATIFPGKVELGQGVVTALAQIAAEELDLPVARVRLTTTGTGTSPDEGFTAGSQSIETGGTALRLAAAEARSILLDRAAARLGVKAARLKTENGVVIAPGGKRLRYGALVTDGMLHREATATIATKKPARYRIVGKSVARLDLPAKVTGGAAFVQDIRLAAMLFGRVVRPPTYRAILTDINQDPVRHMPGVVAIVVNGDFVGVIAEREEQAIAAHKMLIKHTKWSERSELPDPAKIHEWLRQAKTEDTVVSQKTGRARHTAKRLEASFTRPYIAHAPIGPSCAVAQFTAPDRLHVWSQTQGVYPLRRDLAKALAMPASAITVTYAEGSGCYGHDGADDVALDAAVLARAARGRAVKVQWMGDDEFAWEPYGPAMVSSVRAGLSANGMVTDWQYEVWSNTHSTRPGAPGGVNLLAAWEFENRLSPSPPQAIPLPAGGGDRNALPLYEFPNQKVVNHLVPDMPLRVSALRSAGAYHNVFALESFMDELAAAAGADPVDFRLRHLKDPRAKAVIEAAARKSGWKRGAKPRRHGSIMRGRGLGFAKYENRAAYVAVVADVVVERAGGAVRVARLTAAVDAGLVINPNGLVNQIEGGCIQSTSWTLHEEVQFDRKRIISRDWIGYPILTFPEMPEIEVTLLHHRGRPALGVGEAAQGPTVAAIANAFAQATGRRLRDLPMTPDRVRHALA